MVGSYLEYTDFNILVFTNKPKRFKGNSRLTIMEAPEWSLEVCHKFDTFDVWLKHLAIEHAYLISKPDVVYYIDSDLICSGWDNDSWQELVNIEDVDIWTSQELQHTCWRLYNPNAKVVQIPPRKRWSIGDPVVRNDEGEWYISEMVRTFREDRVIYTNPVQVYWMSKLWHDFNKWNKAFGDNTDVWRTIRNEHHKGSGSILFGEAAYIVGSRVSMVDTKLWTFAKYENVVNINTGEKLDREWLTLEKDTESDMVNMKLNFGFMSDFNKKHYQNRPDGGDFDEQFDKYYYEKR